MSSPPKSATASPPTPWKISNLKSTHPTSSRTKILARPRAAAGIFLFNTPQTKKCAGRAQNENIHPTTPKTKIPARPHTQNENIHPTTPKTKKCAGHAQTKKCTGRAQNEKMHRTRPNENMRTYGGGRSRLRPYTLHVEMMRRDQYFRPINCAWSPGTPNARRFPSERRSTHNSAIVASTRGAGCRGEACFALSCTYEDPRDGVGYTSANPR
jgi:hypothetical protein